MQQASTTRAHAAHRHTDSGHGGAKVGTGVRGGKLGVGSARLGSAWNEHGDTIILDQRSQLGVARTSFARSQLECF